MTKLDELRAFFELNANSLIGLHPATNGRFVDCTQQVRELLAETARLEALVQVLEEGIASIDSNLGSAMDFVDQDAKRIAKLEAENATQRQRIDKLEAELTELRSAARGTFMWFNSQGYDTTVFAERMRDLFQTVQHGDVLVAPGAVTARERIAELEAKLARVEALANGWVARGHRSDITFEEIGADVLDVLQGET